MICVKEIRDTSSKFQNLQTKKYNTVKYNRNSTISFIVILRWPLTKEASSTFEK